MNRYYPHLLSPLKVRGKFYKNRMGFPRAVPSNVSGVRADAPLDSMGLYLGGMARNGASVVCVNSPTWDNPLKRPLPTGQRAMFDDKGFDLNVPNTQLAYVRIVEAIHNYGSLACISLMQMEPSGWDINSLTPEVIDAMGNMFAEKCQIYKSLGFDQCCFYMSYSMSMLAKSMSPVFNNRTDKYGGKTMTERAALPREIFSKVRAACGPDFIIEAQISGEEHHGYTVADMCEWVKACEDLIDVAQLRAPDGSLAHPIGINSLPNQNLTLKYAEALKKTGTSVIVAPVGGYQDPDFNEKILAEGKADFIYMARAFFCDSHYGEKISEGRAEDITPCVRCNSCHTRWNLPDSGCRVNPEQVLSLDHNFKVEPPTASKKVAVIGGGPAGMEAALIAARRGHRVTLYEKSDVLGGQLLHTEHASFKWPLRKFKDFMAAQVKKSAIDLRLGVTATPELLKDEQFDAIILAAGAKPVMPDIPGVSGDNVWDSVAFYGQPEKLGKKVVVIGGSMTGVEGAIYLAMNGHDVTVLTRKDRIAHDAQPVHFREIYEEAWKPMSNFKDIAKATVTTIGKDGVTYTDAAGQSQIVPADSVVACGGFQSIQDNALEFAALTGYFRVVGDCQRVNDVRTAMKSAYLAATGI